MARSEFEQLLEPVLDTAYGVALRLTHNQADAEDLVQEAALLAYRGFKTFQRGSNFRAWFMRILMNAFLSSRRKKRPEQEAVEFDEVPSAYMQRQAHEMTKELHPDVAGFTGSDLVREVLGKLETEDVEKAIGSLPDEFRAAATLYFLQDLPYQEIAEVLGVPVGTVRSRLHRGRALLQRQLWRIAQDHGLVPAAGRRGT